MGQHGAGGFHVYLSVGNTNRNLTDRLLELCQCGRVRFVENEGTNNKDQHHWYLRKHSEVRRLLSECLKYLLLKREQAEIIMSLPAVHAKAPEARMEAYLRLKALNRKGRP
jgi:hypothetical protein